MKILNSVQELWSYCLFCPICQDVVRDVQVSVGPDDVFKLVRTRKTNHFLYLDCIAKTQATKAKYHLTYRINGLDNSFHQTVTKTDVEDPAIEKFQDFYFYLQGNCANCYYTGVASTDLELDLLNGKIVNIGVERETVFISSKELYDITLNYVDSSTLITKWTNEDQVSIEDLRPFTTKLLDLDFSKPKKVINKIKTIMTFS